MGGNREEDRNRKVYNKDAGEQKKITKTRLRDGGGDPNSFLAVRIQILVNDDYNEDENKDIREGFIWAIKYFVGR